MDTPRACLYLAIILISIVGLSHGSAWSYSGPRGPSNWGKTVKGASACLGHKQSPININTEETRAKSFPPFVLSGYDLDPNIHPAPRPVNMLNNGHTVQVNLEGPYQLSGGGLPHTYTAVQFHFHWGAQNNKGSEHTLDGRAYPAEMHIVHYDSTTYNHVLDAITEPDGLAVMGFFIKLGTHNYAWDSVINHIEAVRNDLTPYQIPDAFALSLLIPRDLSRFYRYNGSLTTPGCYESVIWTVFENTINLSYLQMAQLRGVFNPDSHGIPEKAGHGPARLLEKLQGNFRPSQRLWFRTVYQSWPREDSTPYGEDAQPAWYRHFIGNFQRNQGAGEAPVDETDLEDDAYGAYIGGGDGMERFWQGMRHGDYADHQDLEYYDYNFENVMDGELTQDTIHDSHNGPNGVPHGGTDIDPQGVPHVGTDTDPQGVPHVGITNGPKVAINHDYNLNDAQVVNQQYHHDQNENVPQGTSSGPDVDHYTDPQGVPHVGITNGPKVAINHDYNLNYAHHGQKVVNQQSDHNQTGNVPEGLHHDPQMVTQHSGHADQTANRNIPQMVSHETPPGPQMVSREAHTGPQMVTEHSDLAHQNTKDPQGTHDSPQIVSRSDNV